MRKLIAKAASVVTLAMALLCSPAWASEHPPGRPYTIDDLLNQAAFGAASIDPTDRWVVFEQAAPYAASGRFDLGLYVRAATQTLWVADTQRNEPPRRLLSEAEGAGHVIGDWSPSGRRLLVFRLQADRWRLGVVEMESRSVRWLDVNPEGGGFGRVVQWRSDDTLVLIDRRTTALPPVMGWDAGAMALTRDRWARQASGAGPTATVLGSGRFGDEIPVSPPVDLVEIDLRTGSKRRLSTGRFFDLELSPDRSHLAAMSYGAMPPVDQTRPLWPVDKPERRHLQIIDLDSGAVRHPCDDCAVAPSLMAWSPDSRRVLAWMMGPDGPTSGELAALQSDGGVQTFDRFGLEPDVAASIVASFTTVRAVWQGDRPVLRARRGPGERYDWYRLNGTGAINLSGRLSAAPVRMDGVQGDDLIAIADGKAWRLPATGQTVALGGPTDVQPFSPFGVLAAPRDRLNTPGAGPLLAVDPRGRLLPVTSTWRTDASVDPDVLVHPVTGSSAWIVEETERNGVRSLDLRGPAGRVRTLATLNAYLSDVTFAKPVAVAHAGPGNEALTSWLYLPTRPSTGKIPLVVLTYPGGPAPEQRDPAEFMTELNFQQLTAAGYAVLTPSVPRSFFPAEPAKGLADQLLAVVDTTLAQHPELDGSRLVYWGQSFGGYSGLVVATQTDRFRSIIVQASVSNLSHKWGEFAPWVRADPRWGTLVRSDAGWAEQSQGAMGGPPWSDPDRYVRNSPLFNADRIRSPILIMHGDRDMGLSQAEALYSALWRQNKDVRFVTWWGEGHTVESAANLREMYRQILTWLQETTGPDQPAPPTSAPTRTAPSSIGPSSPPEPRS